MATKTIDQLLDEANQLHAQQQLELRKYTEAVALVKTWFGKRTEVQRPSADEVARTAIQQQIDTLEKSITSLQEGQREARRCAAQEAYDEQTRAREQKEREKRGAEAAAEAKKREDDYLKVVKERREQEFEEHQKRRALSRASADH